MMRVLVACLIVGVVALVLPSPAAVRPAVQESTPAAPTAIPTQPPLFESSLIARADLDALPAGSATITVTSVTLAPGAATQPFANPGPTLIVVQDGSVTLDADAAVIGVPNISGLVGIQPATAPPAAAASVVVPEDWQVLLPSGARAQLRNATDDTVDLLLLAIVPLA